MHATRMRKSALAIAIAAATVVPAAHAQIEEVVVTAQKRAESIQDVPISVSAFDAEALDAQQIDGFTDLQFSVPNVSFSKGNFTGSNFTIRGIGTLLTATSGDSGVAQHVNDVYLQSPRLFETEYYDMEQVEILRGPQGTLFGRNSTGGAVNLKTAKPNFDGMGADLELQGGNFENARIKGAINVPLSDTLAVRLAGIYLERDGYTNNQVTGNDIDDREQFSLRGSLRWYATENTTVDLMASYFEEDSSRSRSQKQFCDQDPSGILGCLPTTLATESINGNATLGQLFASNLVVGALTGNPGLGVFNVFAPVADQNPDDVRDVAAFFDPEYEADESLFIANISHDFNEWLTATAIVSYQETEVFSRMDYNGTAGGNGQVQVPAAFCGAFPAACQFYGTSAGGPLWFSSVPDAGTSLGAQTGDFVLDSTGAARDLSAADSEQVSAEFRLTTALDGPWNFLLSGYYLDFETETDYVVQAGGLDYANTLFGTAGLAGVGAIDPTVAFGNAGTPFFNSETDRFGLESFAVFGEAYYDVTDTVKVTFGLRYSEDEKSLRDRQLPLLAGATTITGLDGSQTYIGANGPVPVNDLTELLAASAAAGEYDGDPSTPGNQLFRDASDTFDAVTGRIVVDWAPDLSFTDDTLIYASYSIGFKSGGLNPPVDAALFGATPATFDNEEIDAYEIGTKNTLYGGRLQANMNLFYYDYGDLQIGKIVNRTSLNENTDAEIFGFEGEFVFAPTENWLFNATVAWIDTELDDTQTVDPRDPVQGRTDVSLFKDPIGTNNCSVAFGNNAPVSASGIPAAVAGVGGFYLPTGVDLGPAFGNAQLPTTPGVTDSAIASCAALEAVIASGLFPGYEFFGSGIETNLEGNELPSAPEWQVSLGAQYTHFFGNGMSLTGRLDYYWQDDYYATAFNRPQDLIDDWDIVNAQVTLTSADERWYLRIFGQNLANDDNITGVYATDPSSGLFTNAFFVEPRLYGATFGVSL